MQLKVSLRNMDFAKASVTDIKQVAILPEVAHALAVWIKSKSEYVSQGVLIGGLAMSFYAKPRYTEDVDILFLSKASIPEEVFGFKRIRPSALVENITHVEIETTYPEAIHLPEHVAHRVFDTSVHHSGIRVASAEAMVVLKLYGSDTKKREYKDLADVVAVLEHRPELDLTSWDLSDEHKRKLEDARRRASS